jgi:hypothetical protein
MSVLEVASWPFRFVGRLATGLGRLLTGRKR